MAKAWVVVYDACVLYPATLRDLLVQLATVRVFQAKWTDQIHEEWIRNLRSNRPDCSIEQLHRIRDLMNRSVLDCLIEDFESLIPTLLALPDPNDAHVLAAAIQSQAQTIVTFNVKDFPASVLDQYGVAAQHPDDFLVSLLDRNPQQVLQSLEQVRNRLKNPSKTFEEYLVTLQKQGLKGTVAKLHELNKA
jgi:predicted nucleic acid-binding protein